MLLNKKRDCGHGLIIQYRDGKKEADRFLLYINNQLVDTVELNKKNDALRNFEGIGIVTVHKQSSGIERISLSVD